MRYFLLLFFVTFGSATLAMSDKPKQTEAAQSPKVDAHAKYEEYRKKMHSTLDRSCQSDADCQPTCMFGAVNKKWLEKHKKDFFDCSDGCMGWGQMHKCVDKVCTTLEGNGKLARNKNCNG